MPELALNIAANKRMPDDLSLTFSPPRNGSVGDFITYKIGTPKWVVAPRLTPALKAKGYKAAVTPARYAQLTYEYEVKEYGAPLVVLRDRAHELLRALDNALGDLEHHAKYLPHGRRRYAERRRSEYQALLHSIKGWHQ